MIPRRPSVPWLLALALVASAALPGLAEVSADRHNGKSVGTLQMDLVHAAITEGADPIPRVRWQPFRRAGARLLNPAGEMRDDGGPDVAFAPRTFWPLVVWAYNNGTDHDIAFAEWDGLEWSSFVFLTATAGKDELDPRLFVEPDGTLHAVWWVAGEDSHVEMARRRPFGVWSPPLRISLPGDAVARPSIAVTPETVWIAWEAVPVGAGQDAPRRVVVQPLDRSDVPLTLRSFPANRDAELDPIVHVERGLVWLDWKLTDTAFGWATMLPDGTWTDATPHPWPLATWLGSEIARLEIRRRVFVRASFPTPLP